VLMSIPWEPDTASGKFLLLLRSDNMTRAGDHGGGGGGWVDESGPGGGPPPGPPMPPAEMLTVAEQSFSPCFPCRSSWPHRRPPPGTCAIRIKARVAAAAGWGVPRGVSLPNFLERREGRRVRVRVRPRAPPSLPGYRGVDVLPFSET
jgi:hypothetical protein